MNVRAFLEKMPSLGDAQQFLTTHMTKKRAYIAGGILLCALAYGLFFKSSNPEPVIKSVFAQNLKPETLYQTVTLQGVVKAKKQATLKIKSGGILSILKKNGSSVKKEDILAKIENPEAEKNYLAAKDGEIIAKEQFDRAQSLFKTGVSSKNMLEDKKNAYLEAQSKSANAKTLLEKNQIIAPFDGTVGMFKFQDGEEVQDNTDLVTVYDDSDFFIDFDIPYDIAQTLEKDAHILWDGQEQSIEFDRKILDRETKMCRAYAHVQQKKLVIGSIIPIELVVQKKENTIMIPFRAVFLNDEKPHVYKAVDKKATLTPVELGARQKDKIEVLKGLTPEDDVITQGYDSLFPGMPIDVSILPKLK